MATDYILRQWREFLERNCALALASGGSLPFHVRLGAMGLEGSRWPAGPLDFDDEFASVEDVVVHEATISEAGGDALAQLTLDGFNALAAAYGMPAHSLEDAAARSR